MTHLEEHSSIITFVDPLPRPDLGSLLRSFSSPYFTLDMLVNYLFTKKDIQGVHDFLVNKLYSYRDFEVEFYIPQISYMVVKYHSPSLEKFLVDKCSGNITLFLKIYWCVLAYGQAERKKKLRYEYVESLLKRCELSMINGNLSRVVSLDRSTISSTSDKADRTEMMKMEYHRKKMKADYLTATYKFINILTSVSLKLKTLKGEERKPQLKLYVKRVNRWMQQLRKKHIADKDEYFRKLFYGVHIPFSSDKEDNSTMIVNILEDEVTCFNTKMRAPYRIVVETVDMEEIGSMEANVKFRGHHSHTASRSSRQFGDKSISSDLDTSIGEEDAFQDLLEEQQKHKEKEKNTTKATEQQTSDKYKGLAEFENFLQEEEFKAQDGNIEQSDDMMQRFEFLQKGTNSEEYPNLISPAKKGFDDFPDFMDGGRKSSLMTHQAPLTQARRSLMADKPPGYPRSMSPDHQTAEGNVKYLESLLPNQKIPEGVRAKGEEILDGLREQANEELAGEGEAKTVDAYPLEKEPEIIGWGPWEELWEYKKNVIRQKSIFGHYQSYKLRCLIVKANDDLRQELIAMQIMKKFTAIWKEAGLSLRVRTYDILVTSEDSGIIEFVSDSYSIDGLKKKYPGKSLLTFFKETYGFDFEEAQKNFIDSLAAYCLICYFLQIKDRHNGNILLDAYGHIVHIDFGFILCTSPGGINFESAPFKLTREYGEMMGGPNSNTYTYFKLQLTKGFMELRKHVEELAYLIQIMVDGSDLACFEKFDLQEFKERFKERSTDEEAVEHVSKMCDMSYDNWRTVQYDNFQKYTNGVLP